MKIFERYFERNEIGDNLDFDNEPSAIVVIPVLNDRDIFATLHSLTACSTLAGAVGVVVVVNHSEVCGAEVKIENQVLARELKEYAGREMPGFSVRVMEAFDLPAKFAGVGLARKIAMDAAVFYLYRSGKERAPLISLDADTLVAPNYLDDIIFYFRKHKVAGVSIAYEHRLEGEKEKREAMVKYELYLRYYQQALKYAGHPYAYTCIGSAFAVRACDYVAQGGMNRRQAGEDFYFIQKLIATGRYGELKSTRVYPSSRFSERTPFGTGRTLKQIMADGGGYKVYCFEAFEALRRFFAGLPSLYQSDECEVNAYFNRQPDGLRHFLEVSGGMELWREVNANSGAAEQFIKRFFDRFNAFRVLKYLNYVHDGFYVKADVVEAVQSLFVALDWPCAGSPEEYLQWLRKQ
jgi:hypothetical protein